MPIQKAVGNYPDLSKPLMNKQRARAVLEQYDFDGLIALKPVNVYYLTNTMPVMTRFRYDLAALAVFPCREDLPAFFIGHAPQSWDLANGVRATPEMISYSAAADWEHYVNATEERLREEPRARKGGYNVKQGAVLSMRESRWMEAQQHAYEIASANQAWALSGALKRLGLLNGRFAIDDMRIAYLLAEIGAQDAVCIPGENIFRLIRMVKTPAEIEIMRVAGANNAKAALRTVSALEIGMTAQDVEQLFRVECAFLGSDIVSMVCGVTIGGFPEGEITAGKPFLIDAVSHFGEYLGDFGRTVVVGEASHETMRRVRANQAGRDAVMEIMKPGTKFSDLIRVGCEVQIKAGMPEQIIIANPHSVGLEHGDTAMRPDVRFNAPMDHVLEENMVLTMDLPFIEVGWGAGHNEDLVRITKNGFELMNEEADPILIV